MVSPLPEFVTLDEAKQHLRLPYYGVPSAEDDDLRLKLAIAHELVLDYISQRVSDSDAWVDTVDAWTVVTVPKRVRGAILYECGRLYRFRGDDEESDREPVLARSTRLLLDRFRDPTMS